MNTIRFRVWTAAFCLILIALLTQTTRAQTAGYLTDSNTRGLAPGNSFQSADIDHINLGNGALNLYIPLFGRKGRGLDSGAFVTYSSKIWVVMPFWDGLSPSTLDAVRWTLSDPGGFKRWVQFGTINTGDLGYTTDVASFIINNIQ